MKFGVGGTGNSTVQFYLPANTSSLNHLKKLEVWSLKKFEPLKDSTPLTSSIPVSKASEKVDKCVTSERKEPRNSYNFFDGK